MSDIDLLINVNDLLYILQNIENDKYDIDYFVKNVVKTKKIITKFKKTHIDNIDNIKFIFLN